MQGQAWFFIFLDTVRQDDALASTPPAMPQLAAFARRSAAFHDAWAPASWTVPSHYAVSGVEPWTIRFDGQGFHGDVPMLAERFHAAATAREPYLPTSFGPAKRGSRAVSMSSHTRDSGVCRSGVGNLLQRLNFMTSRGRLSVNGFLLRRSLSLLRAADGTRHDATLALLDQRVRRPAISHYLVEKPFTQAEGAFSVVGDGYHFIRWLNAREALYSLQDPDESALIDVASLGATAAAMRDQAIRAAAQQRATAEFRALGYMR